MTAAKHLPCRCAVAACLALCALAQAAGCARQGRPGAPAPVAPARPDPAGGPAAVLWPAIAAEEDEAVARTRAALAKPVDVAFHNTPLPKALEVLSQACAVPIRGHPGLESAGIDLSIEQVTLKLTQVPGAEILRLMLGEGLACEPRPDYVLILPRDAPGRRLPIALYPVGDLLLPRGRPDEEGGLPELLDIITRRVNSMSDPDVAAWTDEGGSAAIDYVPGILVVCQTRRAHARTAELLRLVRLGLARAARATAGAGDVPTGPIRTPEDAAVAEVRARLARPIDVAFDGTPLREAVETVAQALDGLNLAFSPELAEPGTDLSVRTATLKRKQAPAAEVLDEILGPDLACLPRPNYLLITTRDAAWQRLPLAIYPVEDLLAQASGVDRRSRLEGPDVADVTDARMPEGDFIGPYWGDEAWDPSWMNWQYLVDIILKGVNCMSDPDVAAWMNEGGPATIDYFRGMLLVTQTDAAHRRIAALLDMLRQAYAVVEEQLEARPPASPR